jgi:uncharacterized protein DUF3106
MTMKLGLQFGGWMLALGISAMAAMPCAAQKQRKNDRPPHQQQQRGPAQRQNRPQGMPQGMRPPRGGGQERIAPRGPGENRPPAGSENSFGGGNRPPNATVRPRDLSPDERMRLRQNEQRFRQLPPQQQQEMRERAQVWQKMTPEQQTHIRNDVLPRWKQLPPDRQRAIQHRLAVLQNMPESARNQHLNDPNFTRGMSEEDKSTLRDLSHLHVGGAPDPPGE